MKDLEKTKLFLRLQIKHFANVVFIHQSTYTKSTSSSQSLFVQRGRKDSALLASSSGQCIIDRGAIDHYSGMSTIFSSLNPSTSLGKLKLADGSTTPIVGSGTVKENHLILNFKMFLHEQNTFIKYSNSCSIT